MSVKVLYDKCGATIIDANDVPGALEALTAKLGPRS